MFLGYLKKSPSFFTKYRLTNLQWHQLWLQTLNSLAFDFLERPLNLPSLSPKPYVSHPLSLFLFWVLTNQIMKLIGWDKQGLSTSWLYLNQRKISTRTRKKRKTLCITTLDQSYAHIIEVQIHVQLKLWINPKLF